MIAFASTTFVPPHASVGPAATLGFIDAIANAGFDAASISNAHHEWVVAGGVSTEEFLERHFARELSIPAVEVLTNWVTRDLRAVEDEARPILELARRAGARTVIAAALAPTADFPTLTAGLAHLCRIAAHHGLLVSFEFLPWAAIPDLSSTVRLLDAVDQDNLGVVVDVWHWYRQRGSPDPATLAAIPADRLHVLQLSDARARPADNLRRETATGRLLPGDGAIDIDVVVDTLLRRGVQPIVTTEVFSTSLVRLGPDEMARRALEATRKVLHGRLCSPPRPGPPGWPASALASA